MRRCSFLPSSETRISGYGCFVRGSKTGIPVAELVPYPTFSRGAKLSSRRLTPTPASNSTVTSVSAAVTSQAVTTPSPKALWRTESPTCRVGRAEVGWLMTGVGACQSLQEGRLGGRSPVDRLPNPRSVEPPPEVMSSAGMSRRNREAGPARLLPMSERRNARVRYNRFSARVMPT